MIVGSRKLPWFVLMCLLVAFLTVAACGGDDDDADDDSGVEVPATSTAEGTDDDDEDEADATPEDDDEADVTPGDDAQDDDEDDDEGSGVAVDVCALLTVEEVSTALGVAVEAGENQDFDPIYSCLWSGPALESVSVSVLTGSDEALDAYYDLSEDAEEVDGLGERAQWQSGILNFLEIMTDDYVVDVSVQASDLEEEQAKTIAIDLAEKILDRVP